MKREQMGAWLRKRWRPDYTCLDFACEVSGEILGWRVSNPERDPDVLRELAAGRVPTTPGTLLIDQGQPLAAGDVLIVRPVLPDQPFHAAVVIDPATVREQRCLELSRGSCARVVPAGRLELLAVARFRPCQQQPPSPQPGA